MRLLKVSLLAVILYAFSLSAQTVDEIIARNLEAHGGVAKLKAIQSMRLTGNFETTGMQAGFTQVFKRPLKMRLDATVQGVTLTQAYDGQNGWEIIPFTGKNTPGPMNADDLKRTREDADLDGPLMDYKQKGNTVQLIGKEKVDGVDAYHLQVTLKNGEIRHLYLDATTYLTTKESGKTVMQGQETDIENKFSDFREVNGIKFPFSVEQRSADGQMPEQKITLQKVDLNVPVEDSFFKMPAAAPAAPPATGQPKKP